MKTIFAAFTFLIISLFFFSNITRAQPITIKEGQGFQRGRIANGVGLSQLSSGDFLLTSLTLGGFVLGDGLANFTRRRVWLGLYDKNLNLKFKIKVPDIKPYYISDPKWVLQQIVIDDNDLVNLFYSNNRGKMLELWKLTFNPKTQEFGEGTIVWKSGKKDIYGKDDYAKFSIRKLPSKGFKVYVMKYSSLKSGTEKKPELGHMELSGDEVYSKLPRNFTVEKTFYLDSNLVLNINKAEDEYNGSYIMNEQYCLTYNSMSDDGQYTFKLFDYIENKLIFSRKTNFMLSAPSIVDYNKLESIFIVVFASSENIESDHIISYEISTNKNKLIDSSIFKIANFSDQFTLQTYALIEDFKKEVRSKNSIKINYNIDIRDSALLLSCIEHANYKLIMKFLREDFQTGFKQKSSTFTYFQSYYSKVQFVSLCNKKKEVYQDEIIIDDHQYEIYSMLGGYMPFLSEQGESSFFIGYRIKSNNNWIDYNSSNTGISNGENIESIKRYGQILMNPFCQISENQRIVISRKKRRMKPILITY